MILLLYYPGSAWRDVLSYEEMAIALERGSAFYPKLLELPSCKHTRSAAHCVRKDHLTVEVIWKDNETNHKNNIDPVSVFLTWERQEDVLCSCPTKVWWEDNEGNINYPIPTLIKTPAGKGVE